MDATTVEGRREAVAFWTVFAVVCLVSVCLSVCLSVCHRYADYSVSCDGDGYAGMVTLATVSLVIYAAGIPIFYFLLLRWERDELYTEASAQDEAAFYSEFDRKYYIVNDELADRLGFLFAAYEPGVWYFEVLSSSYRCSCCCRRR